MFGQFVRDDEFEQFIAQHQEMGRGFVPRDFAAAPYCSGSGSISFAASGLTIPPREAWPDLIRQEETNHSTLEDIADDGNLPCLNQQSLNYCHAFSSVGAFMLTRMAQGKPFELLSPSSIGGPVTHFSNSGADIKSDLEQMIDVGVVPASHYPMNTTHNYLDQESKNLAAGFRALKYVDFDPSNQTQMQNEIAGCLFNRIPVVFGLNSMRHAMFYLRIVLISNSPLAFGFRIQNSWGTQIQGWTDKGRATFPFSKGTANEAYGLLSVT